MHSRSSHKIKSMGSVVTAEFVKGSVMEGMDHDMEGMDHDMENATSSEGGSNSIAPPTEEKMTILQFTDLGEAYGSGSAQASTYLGYLTRTHVSIKYKDWRVAEGKDNVWKALKKKYNFTEAQKHIYIYIYIYMYIYICMYIYVYIYMKKAGLSWKKYKFTLRDFLTGPTFESWIKAKPEGITTEDWYAYCVNESTPEQKQLREKNKNNKREAPMKTTHNTGRWGYARAEQKFIERHGRKPLLVELWLKTHKRKDGTYAPHDQENAVKFQKMAEIMREKGEKDTKDSGALFDAFGLNKRGRTRCVSSVISRTAILASSFGRHLLQEINEERQDVGAQLESLHKDNGNLKQQLKELAEGLKSGAYNAYPKDHSYVSSASDNYDGSGGSDSTRPSNVVPTEVRCAIYSHNRKLVGYGIKNPPGSVLMVHGHTMAPKEARVVLEKIVDPSYPL